MPVTILKPPASAPPAAPRRRVASLSVDLDPLGCYAAIHGLPPPPEALRHVVLRRALPRFLELFRRYGVRATLFVVGSDLEDGENRELLRQAAAEGHELGNHSHRHPYDLGRRPAAEIREDLTACHEALRALLGAAPRGFRAPGYDLTPALFDVVQELGYRYDSSLLPSWPYYLAKLGAMAMMALVRRPSRAVRTGARALLCPPLPYRPDGERPWQRGQALCVELPIATTPGTRLPAIGTTLVLSEALRHRVLEAMRARPFFNLEMHGLDLVGAAEDRVPAALVRRQPDLRVDLVAKERALRLTLERLGAEYEYLPLREVADEVHRTGGIVRATA